MSKYMLYSHAHNAYIAAAYYDHDGDVTISFTTDSNKAKRCTYHRDARNTARTIDRMLTGMDLDIMDEYEIESKAVIFKESHYTNHPCYKDMTDIYEKMLTDRIEKLESESDKLKEIIAKIRKEEAEDE